MMQLTEHFSLLEMTRSETGTRKGIDNTLPRSLNANIEAMAKTMEVVRHICGDKPVRVYSCYRSPRVNTAVGGSKTSSHMFALATDFIIEGLTISETINIIRHSDIKFDQIIDEFNSWVHLGIDPAMRHQVLSARKKSGTTVYANI